MKKYLLSMIIVLGGIYAKAQGDIVITGSKPLSKKLTPQQVIDSIGKRFPDAKSIKYYSSKEDVANKGWNVTEEDNLHSNADVEYYTVSFKQEGMNFYGLYNQDGELLQTKIEHSVDDLPDTIKSSLKELGQKYPGYKVISKTYYLKENEASKKEYYEVVAQKGDTKKRLYYSTDGTLTKVKD
jgi:hypothetical protein